jgi:photosystem II stability/assembly factor-like uncharacterized protein
MSIQFFAALLASVLALAGASVQADSLVRPARPSALVAQRLITAVAAAGPEHLVAVGQRGHVLTSSNAGATWSQVLLPLSSDLTAVQFVDAQNGYAVGHDGVALGTHDGGASWRKLLDGIAANALVLAQLQQTPASAERDRLLLEAQRNIDAGPDKPFLDLYFSSPQEGFVVGAYNLIFQTHDGGKTWQSWYDRTDNTDKLLNLNVIRKHKGQLFVVGEAGLLMRLDAARQRFVHMDTGYKGSFFGLLDTGDSLIAHGMRGNAFISRDGGTQWVPLTTGLTNTIVGSAKGSDGSLWLADQVGAVVVSRDGGQSFRRVALPISLPLTAIYVTPSTLVLAGIRGLRSVPLPKE